MRTRVCFATLLVVASNTVLPMRPVMAQEKDAVTEMARRRFQEGVKFFDQKKYEEARAAFLQAYALKRHPAVLLNLAQSEIRSGHAVEAARHFSAYLRESPNASSVERGEAEKGLASARTKLSRIQITAPAGADVIVDGDAVGQAPLPEPLDVIPGTHIIEAKHGGHSASTTVSVLVGRLTAATLAFESPAAPPPPAAPAEPPASTPPAAPAQEPTEPAPAPETPKEPEPNVEATAAASTEDEREGFFTWVGHHDLAFVGLGLTGIGLGVFVGFGFAGERANENVESVAIRIRQEAADERISRTNLCADPIEPGFGDACGILNDNLDTRKLDRTVAAIGLITAGVSLGATLTAYFLSGKSSGQRAQAYVAPITGPHQSGLAVGGRF